jgi:hypothetical protein
MKSGRRLLLHIAHFAAAQQFGRLVSEADIIRAGKIG